MSKLKLKIVTARTEGDYTHLGEWVAQIKGLPQARTYGASEAEAFLKLFQAFGKEHGIVMLPAEELDSQRTERTT